MNKNAEKLHQMGYKVGVAIEGYADKGYEHEDGSHAEPQSCPTVYSITGFGIQGLHVNEGDEDSWARLTNPDAHQYRIDYLRHTDPEDSFEFGEGEAEERSLQVAVKLGDITEKEAAEARKARAET